MINEAEALDISYFVNYDPSDGRIWSSGSCDTDLVFRAKVDDKTLLVTESQADIRTQYVLDGVLTARPQMTPFDAIEITADGVDAATFTLDQTFTYSLDGEAEVTVGSEPYELVFTAASPGSYHIVIKSWPYVDYEVYIEAT